jgi:hypothetical protein
LWWIRKNLGIEELRNLIFFLLPASCSLPLAPRFPLPASCSSLFPHSLLPVADMIYYCPIKNELQQLKNSGWFNPLVPAIRNSLIRVHPETPDETLAVSDPGRRDFSFWQGKSLP